MTLDFNKANRQDSPLFEDAEARKQRIEKALKSNIRAVVRHLYPRAQIGPRDARVGDVDGTPGFSMSIALTPNEAGMWIDHATTERGDVFELFMRALGLSTFSEALSEAEAFTGGKPTYRQVEHKVLQDQKPAPEKPEVIDTIDYVYRGRDGKRIATVYRDVLANGKKTFRVHRSSDSAWSAPVPRPLYRIPDIASAREVVLVEGEKCADALGAAGISSTTAMFGSNTDMDKIDWTPLAGKRVIIWPDNDKPGFEYAARVRPVLEAMGCTVSVIDVPADKPEGWDAADAIEDGQGVNSYIEGARPAEKRRLPILSVSQLADMEPPEWLIDGMLVENGFSALYSPSESFKSFLALDIALSVATGQDWRQKLTKAGPVVYLIGEGVSGWPARVFTWLERRGNGADAAFFTIPTSIALTEQEDAVALLETIQGVCERPAMIVIDTLARNFGGGDENSTQDMNAFVKAVDLIREATGAHVMIIHHTGKDSERGARGSSVLRAALDTEMQCHRPNMDGPFVQFKITKQKDIEKGEPMTFEMVRVEAVHPKTREVISSLVPVLRDVPDVAPDLEKEVELEIVQALLSGPKTIKELGEETGRQRRYLSKTLSILEKNGVVFADRSSKAAIWQCAPESAPNNIQQKQEYDQ